MENYLGRVLRAWLLDKNSVVAHRSISDFAACSSDIGLTRKENQDAHAILMGENGAVGKFWLAVLSDGMGGMSGGSDCSAIAIAEFITSYLRSVGLDTSDTLAEAARSADAAVYKMYAGKGGATLSVVLATQRGGSWWLNVGDSRVYAADSAGLSLLSKDDTIAGQLGRAEPQSAADAQLLQFVGMGQGIQPHVAKFADSEKRALITSDGAHFVGELVLGKLLSHSTDVSVFNKRLISLARWLGGRDNATVVSIELDRIPFEAFDGFAVLSNAFGSLAVGLEPAAYRVSDVNVLDSGRSASLVEDPKEVLPKKSKRAKAPTAELAAKKKKNKSRSRKQSQSPLSKSSPEQPMLDVAFEKPGDK
jgi:serine/threonine protein phosphatase PrpC